jgi:multiple sugar transport system substrate-binding protein
MKTQRWVAALAAASLTLALTACGSGFGSGSASASQTPGKPITILIGSSGDAETTAVKDAVAAWSTKSGVQAVVRTASNLNQELAQGFAAKTPPDVFYLSADAMAGYAANGSLLAYGDSLPNKADFYDSLVKNFTYKDKLYCAPKDFSTLQLVINTDLWTAAGLTDADVPTTWDQLSTVAKKLTTGKQTGLVMGGEYARFGAFMVAAGGNLTNDTSSQATANTPANIAALQYIKDNLAAGDFKTAADVGAGWGGEAFGKGLGVMTVEGNWITGGLKSDYPNVKYKVVELPAGPAGKGTLQFTNCWGIAADSQNTEGAKSLVTALTATDQQLAFSKAFGVMPSIKSAADAWKTANPALVPFINGASYAKGVPTMAGSSDVVTDLNQKLAQLKTQDPATILAATQTNLQALIK